MTAAAMVVTAAPVRATAARKVISPSGVEAWLVEDYAVPLVAVQFAFTGGASQDPQGKPGVAKLLSACSTKAPGPSDADAFHETLEDKAIDLPFEPIAIISAAGSRPSPRIASRLSIFCAFRCTSRGSNPRPSSG